MDLNVREFSTEMRCASQDGGNLLLSGTVLMRDSLRKSAMTISTDNASFTLKYIEAHVFAVKDGERIPYLGLYMTFLMIYCSINDTITNCLERRPFKLIKLTVKTSLTYSL